MNFLYEQSTLDFVQAHAVMVWAGLSLLISASIALPVMLTWPERNKKDST